MKNCANCFVKNKKISIILLAAVVLFMASAALSLCIGNTKIGITDIIGALDGSVESAGERIFAFVRLPRTLATLVCGAALSVSGAVIQNVLCNRLASPGIIGVNSGAGLAVTLCAAAGIYGGWQLSLFSFLGALITVLFISVGARKWGASRGTVILIGVAINSLFGAFSDAVITINTDISIISSDFKVGDFSAVTYQKAIPAAVIVFVSIAVLFTLSNELDILTLGDETAIGLGLNSAVMRVVFLILAALLAGCAVSVAGLLSFVGLIVPHIIKRLGVTQSKHILPLCALFGAGFVTLCDTLARTIFAPYEIPVGIIMAFVGAPFFIFLLIKGKGGHKNA